jgi:hypothetical protein
MTRNTRTKMWKAVDFLIEDEASRAFHVVACLARGVYLRTAGGMSKVVGTGPLIPLTS